MNKPTPYDALKDVLHEPNRLAVVSLLAGADEGPLTFAELRDGCGLTDGNLSCHLRALEEAGHVQVFKGYEGRRPRTTVELTDSGREALIHYIGALRAVCDHTLTILEENEMPEGLPSPA